MIGKALTPPQSEVRMVWCVAPTHSAVQGLVHVDEPCAIGDAEREDNAPRRSVLRIIAGEDLANFGFELTPVCLGLEIHAEARTNTFNVRCNVLGHQGFDGQSITAFLRASDRCPVGWSDLLAVLASRDDRNEFTIRSMGLLDQILDHRIRLWVEPEGANNFAFSAEVGVGEQGGGNDLPSCIPVKGEGNHRQDLFRGLECRRRLFLEEILHEK